MTTIVITGEGARGAYQAGVIQNLLLNGVCPDRYIGISSGALNAMLFSQIDPRAVDDAISSIKDINSLFSFNYFSFFTAKGLYNSKPIRKILERLLKYHRLPAKDRRNGVVADCNYKTGKIRYTNLITLPESEIINRTLSAISISGLIEPAIQGYIDGGAKEINPLQYTLAQEPDEDIHCIFGRPIAINEENEPSGFFKFAKIAFRSLDITMHDMSIDDLEEAKNMKTRGELGARIHIYQPDQIYYSAIDFGESKRGYQRGLSGFFKKIQI